MSVNGKSLEQQFFNWEGWDPDDNLSLTFYKVEFVADFGDFKKGDKLESITVDYENGEMRVYGDEGVVLKRVPFTLTPVNQ